MKLQRDNQELSSLIAEHLKTHGTYAEDAAWIIKDSPLGGVGVFARRDIDAGEEIFRDFPIILGPRVVLTTSPLCTVCNGGDLLIACSRGCGLPVCGAFCEKSEKHEKLCEILLRWRDQKKIDGWSNKLLECLAPVTSLVLDDFQKRLVQCLVSHTGGKHGYEVDILKTELGMKIEEEEESFMRCVCNKNIIFDEKVYVSICFVQFQFTFLPYSGSLFNEIAEFAFY